MKVSIVINNYNYALFLRDAIDSALAQTYPDCEVIVVDDGSTDDSRAIIEDYGDQIGRVLKENGGQASAFNSGWRAAKGEFILFLDADDYLYPNAVAQAVAAWRPGMAFVHFPLDEVDESGRCVGHLPRKGGLLQGDFREALHIDLKRCVPTSGNLFSKTALDEYFPVDERFRISADAELRLGGTLHGSIGVASQTGGAYRLHGNNFYAGGSFWERNPRKLRSRYYGVAANILTKGGRAAETLEARIIERCRSQDLKDLILAKDSGVTEGIFPELDTYLSICWLLKNYRKKVYSGKYRFLLGPILDLEMRLYLNLGSRGRELMGQLRIALARCAMVMRAARAKSNM